MGYCASSFVKSAFVTDAADGIDMARRGGAYGAFAVRLVAYVAGSAFSESCISETVKWFVKWVLLIEENERESRGDAGSAVAWLARRD